MSLWRIVCGLFFAAALLGGPPAHAQSSEKRIALVIGNGAYPDGALATPANDAGLIAQTLQAAGFDVVGARDLDTATLRSSLREFLDKAAASGPDTVAFVYYAGHGLQFEGENYLVPIDSRIARDADVPLAAIRLNDLVRPLATLPLKARIVVLDAARANPFARSGQPLAGGLALMPPDPGSLIAFNAAPGTIAPEGKDYSAYATALSEMIKQGGLPLDDLFERVRLRTSELTGGAEVPWQASKVQVPFLFFERTSAAPPDQNRFVELRDKPIRGFDARDAYLAALTRDTMRGYQDFLAAYPGDPLAKRVRAILAARREAIVWRESAVADSPEAYWSYLGRYPRGPHAGDAHRRLAHFAVAYEPPASFAALSYDVPPPPPDEIVYVERPVVYFADPVYELPPPPPVPVFFLPPQPVFYVDLAPPPPPIAAFVLPIPIYHPVPLWVERPAYVVPPPVNIVNVNIHNTVVVNPASQTVVVTSPQGQSLPPLPQTVTSGAPTVSPPAGGPVPAPSSGLQQMIQAHPVAAAALAATAAALPAAALLRARQQQTQPPHAATPAATGLQPGAPQGLPATTGQPRPGQPLAGGLPPSATAPAGAKPLPAPAALPAAPGNAAPAQHLAVPPQTPQTGRPGAPPVATAPQAAPSQAPAGAKPLPAPGALPAAPGNTAPAHLAAPPQTPQTGRPGTPPIATAPAGAKPLPAPTALPAAPGNTAPAQHLAAPPQTPQTARPGTPPIATAPRTAPQPAQIPQTNAADTAQRAAAQQAERQRAQQAATLQAQQQRAAQAAQQRAMQAQQQQQQRAAQAQQQRAMQAQQQTQQRAAQASQLQQQRAAQAAQQRAMQAQQQQRAAQASQQRAAQMQQQAAMQAQQRAQMMARPRAPQPAHGPQPQHRPPCEPGKPQCR